MPIRVLHVIDGLGGGGAERCLSDIVRLSDTARVIHRVATVLPEDATWVHARTLRDMGAYGAFPADSTWRAVPAAMRPLLCRAISGGIRPPKTAYGCGRIAFDAVRFKPDIVHGHLFHGVSIGSWLKRWTGSRLVYTLWSRLEQLTDAGAAWVIDDYRRFHPDVDAFLTDPAYVQELTSLGIAAHRVGTFVGAIDFEQVDDARQQAAQHRVEIRRSLGIPPEAALAISVGRLIESKGHQDAITATALSSLSDLHLVVLGCGALRGTLEQLASHLGVADRIKFCGYVSDRYRYYAAADMFLRPYHLEGENTSSHDAMAFGLPVAAFDTSCAVDRIAAVKHGVLVPNRQPAALAAAIDTILSSGDRGRAMGERGRLFAREHLSIERLVTTVTATYEHVHNATSRAVAA